MVSRILVSALLFSELSSNCSSATIWSSCAVTVRTSSAHLDTELVLIEYNS